jgi:hypothetical protein
MVEEKNWNEFRDTGLIWFINTTLHMFGWALVMEVDENNNVTRVYPARVKFRGFSEKINTGGYQKVSKYLKENIEELEKEANN